MKKHLNMLFLSLLVGLVVSGLFLTGTLERLELLTIDLRYQVLTTLYSGEKPPIAVVALDQNSLKEIGRWPIPRGHYIPVLENIYRDGARGILMDLDFSSDGPDPEQDRKLAQYIRQAGSVVLAAQMDEKITGEGVLLRNVFLPVPLLKDSALALGSITFEVDQDGVVRRMPTDIDYIDEIFRPLGSVGAAMIEPASRVFVPAGAMINTGVLAKPAFNVISFQKVARGDFEPGLFNNKVVFMGATSSDLHDFWLTPLGIIPGVFIQAAVLDTMLNGSWLQRQAGSMTLIFIFLFSVVSGWIMADKGWKGGAAALVLLVLLLAGAAMAAAWWGQFMQVVPLLLVCISMYPTQVAAKARKADISLAREREKTEAFLSIAELRTAEEAGQESHFVPLVLLGQNLDLSVLQVYTLSKSSDDTVHVRRIIGDQDKKADPALLDDVFRRGICRTERRKEGGTIIFVPLVTVRETLGAIYAESSRTVDAEDEDVRLLLSFATQTAYFLESLALDLRVKDLYVNTIRAISRALDSKDQYTSAHSELSLDHVEKFARMCGLDREQVESLHVGALLHDIGKIGVPDNILVKKGNLSGEEYETIRKHPVIGSDIVRGLPFPDEVKKIILHHHERYDGTGYPDGLKGEEIPLLVRIFSILDVYEALVGFRPYRDPLDAASAADHLEEGAGTQFDPELVDIFIRCVVAPAKEVPG